MKLVGADITGFWKDICDVCPELNNGGLDLLRGSLDGYAKSALIEPHYVCKDYKSLYSNFLSKKFSSFPPECKRIHFFENDNFSLDDAIFNSSMCGDSYIGYSVVQPIRVGSIGRTVFDPRKIGKDSFFCLSTKFRANINGARYEVNGYPFMMQSAEATVCAHSAMWGVCRYLSERYSIYQEIYPYDLIHMTGDSQGRKVPYRGMSYTDYSEILSQFGCYPLVKRFEATGNWVDDKEKYYDLYTYVESGFPVLVSYKGHVVTFVGHTFDSSANPTVEDRHGYYNSFSMIKEFVVIDDNFPPYQLLGFDAASSYCGNSYSPTNGPSSPCIGNLFATVIPLPEKVFLPADKARGLCYSLLDLPMIRALIQQFLGGHSLPSDEKIITRTFIASSSSFKKRKIAIAKGEVGGISDNMSVLSIDFPMPHFVWVMEFSPRSLHVDGKAIGEVVLDASSSEFDPQTLLYLRVGKYFIYPGNKVTNPSFDEIFPQYTHNLGERS